MKFWLANLCFQLFARVLYLTYRFRYIYPENLEKAKDQSPGGGAVIVTWHGNSFAGTLAHAYQNVAPLVSFSPDGMLVVNLCRKLGLRPVGGSSSRGGKNARNELLDRLAAGDHIAITVDGPKGPIYEAKAGCVDLARKSNAMIVPLRTYSLNAWTLRSWDRLKIPKPFAKVYVVYGEPFNTGGYVEGEKFEAVRNKVSNCLSDMESGDLHSVTCTAKAPCSR